MHGIFLDVALCIWYIESSSSCVVNLDASYFSFSRPFNFTECFCNDETVILLDWDSDRHCLEYSLTLYLTQGRLQGDSFFLINYKCLRHPARHCLRQTCLIRTNRTIWKLLKWAGMISMTLILQSKDIWLVCFNSLVFFAPIYVPSGGPGTAWPHFLPIYFHCNLLLC